LRRVHESEPNDAYEAEKGKTHQKSGRKIDIADNCVMRMKLIRVKRIRRQVKKAT
jgi:hypothetical protein